MLSDLMPFWPVASFALNGAIGVIVCLAVLKMREVARAEIKMATDPIYEELGRIGESVTRHDGKIEVLEKDLLDLPTKADIARVEGKVEGGAREIAGVANGVRRLETFLMQKGNG